MSNTDAFIEAMLAGVVENETMNMHNDDPGIVLAKWKNAQEIIDIYDSPIYDENEELIDGDEWASFTPEQQNYVSDYINNWLKERMMADQGKQAPVPLTRWKGIDQAGVTLLYTLSDSLPPDQAAEQRRILDNGIPLDKKPC